jgi:uncharacterized coiled-coil protein SlyX
MPKESDLEARIEHLEFALTSSLKIVEQQNKALDSLSEVIQALGKELYGTKSN